MISKKAKNVLTKGSRGVEIDIAIVFGLNFLNKRFVKLGIQKNKKKGACG